VSCPGTSPTNKFSPHVQKQEATKQNLLDCPSHNNQYWTAALVDTMVLDGWFINVFNTSIENASFAPEIQFKKVGKLGKFFKT